MSGWTRKDVEDFIKGTDEHIESVAKDYLGKFTESVEAVMAPRKRKLALSSYTPRRHSEESIFAAIRAAIPMNGVFWDYLTEERLVENFGASEYERGVIEGGRRFAGRLQELATPPDIEENK